MRSAIARARGISWLLSTMSLIRPICRARVASIGLRAQHQLVGVYPRDLAWQQDGRVAGGVEAEGDFFEREGGAGYGIANLRGQHQVETAGARVAVDGADQWRMQIESRQQCRPDRAQSLEVGGVDALAGSESLRNRDGAAHVHAGTEYAVASSGQHDAADGVYSLGANGRLNCLKKATGKVVWSTDMANDTGAKTPQWGFSSSPLVHGDLVVVYAGAADAGMIAYDRQSGTDGMDLQGRDPQLQFSPSGTTWRHRVGSHDEQRGPDGRRADRRRAPLGIRLADR